ncbi:MAG: serine/threonine protein kinase [Dysgonamonadaceae bacterium]|jgi:serine/threonine-protein kinase|nr:serine/threonine protein kinase [Dysgonamonadaceae bacterium]
MHLKEGYQLHNGKYQLLNVIGDGGFSLTYKGIWNTEVHGPLGKIPTQASVCIKEYFFKDYCLRNEKTNFVETNSANGKIIFDKYKEKIIKEARILAELHHPNVVKVLEVFKQNNTVYTIMEFISGESLKKEVEQSGTFNEEKLLPVIYKIGQALQYIHEKNILHLDVKPSNILMDGKIPKLIDFGISKRYDPQYQQETSTTIIAASKGFASIEQYDSEGMQIFSPCPDVYALGATMYYLLTGEIPTESILRSTKGLQNPKELNPEISENTEKVILKAMELHANDRYQSIIEMITDLGYDPEKDKVNLPKQPKDNADDDQTVLINPPKKEEEPYDVDDQTEIYSVDEAKEKKNKRNRKILTYSSFIGLLIVIIFASLSLSGNFSFSKGLGYYKENESNYRKYLESGRKQLNEQNFSQAKKEIILAKKYKDTKETDDLLKQIDNLIDLSTAAMLLNNSIDSTTNQGNNDPGIDIDNSKIDAQNQEKVPETTQVRDPEQEKYEDHFNAGTAFYDKKDFKAAKKEFENAFLHKKTTDASDYIKRCTNEIEKIEIEERSNRYEVITEISNFAIVIRKKPDKSLFGMVDMRDWKERVPCIYVSSSPANGGKSRAFERTDGLYDIYSFSEGLITGPVDTYDF